MSRIGAGDVHEDIRMRWMRILTAERDNLDNQGDVVFAMDWVIIEKLVINKMNDVTYSNVFLYNFNVLFVVL